MSPKLLESHMQKERPPRRARPIGIVAVIMTLAVAGPSAARPQASNVISNLVQHERGDSTVIELEASRRPLFTVYRVEHPPRLTIDLKGCRLKGIPRLLDVESRAVSQVATSQFKSMARVMINFRQQAQYTVRAKGKRLVVTITPNKGGTKAAEASAREKSLSEELARMREELAQQKTVARAAVEAATHLRQVAMEARQRLSRLPKHDAAGKQRQAALQDLKAAETKLHEAERARKAAETERARLHKALQASLKRAGELEKQISRKEGARVVKDVRYVDSKGQARVEIVLTGDGVPAHRIQAGAAREPVLLLEGARLPKLLERTLDAREYKGPVKQVTSYTAGPGRVAVKVQLASAGAGRISQVGNKLVWSFGSRGRVSGAERADVPSRGVDKGYSYKSTRVAAARVRRRRPRAYSGRRIDLDFKDADIHNILRLLSEVGNVNIVTSDKVGGKVTIRMKNVPWDQALDVILRAKGLGQVREGNLVRVAPAKDLEAEREAEIARQKQIVLLKPLETRLIPLSYAQAAQALPKIQYMLSPRGKLTYDQRTNMIIARDISGNLDLMERLVRSLDTQTPQVLIEARIVEARTNFSREVGIQWGGAFSASSANGNSTGLVFPNQIGLAGGATDAQTPTEGILLGQATNPNFAVNMPAPVGTGAGGALGLTLGSVSGNVNVNLRLSALESTGDIRIISAPKITTLDNVEAKIEQGVTIPFSQVSAAGVQTTFKDANLNLTVQPHVTADGSINMKVSVTNNEPDFVNTGPRGEPTILKKEARTEMLIKDGDTTVIGGIYTVRTGVNWSKVPWFAEIPILGWFFRHHKDTTDRQEVLVFITPRIINRAQSIGR